MRQEQRTNRRCSRHSATALARQRYRAGEDDLIVLLNAQSAYSASEQQSIAADAGVLNSMVSLYKALGGGWEAFEPKVAENAAAAR
jgi:outer membrane protein TolC